MACAGALGHVLLAETGADHQRTLDRHGQHRGGANLAVRIQPIESQLGRLSAAAGIDAAALHLDPGQKPAVRQPDQASPGLVIFHLARRLLRRGRQGVWHTNDRGEDRLAVTRLLRQTDALSPVVRAGSILGQGQGFDSVP